MIKSLNKSLLLFALLHFIAFSDNSSQTWWLKYEIQENFHYKKEIISDHTVDTNWNRNEIIILTDSIIYWLWDEGPCIDERISYFRIVAGSICYPYQDSIEIINEPDLLRETINLSGDTLIRIWSDYTPCPYNADTTTSVFRETEIYEKYYVNSIPNSWSDIWCDTTRSDSIRLRIINYTNHLSERFNLPDIHFTLNGRKVTNNYQSNQVIIKKNDQNHFLKSILIGNKSCASE